MKYIKTTSEIYNIDDLYICEEIKEKPYATKKGGFCIYKECIVQEADTIEELVDYYIGIRDGVHYFWNKADSKYAKSDKVYKIMTVYGAIWTDRGLIYVAKMNNNGELELL